MGLQWAGGGRGKWGVRVSGLGLVIGLGWFRLLGSGYGFENGLRGMGNWWWVNGGGDYGAGGARGWGCSGQVVAEASGELGFRDWAWSLG
ncbi:hypothetical protein GOBAR_AA24225 [Gossypium barbadense]|uniref:Uncharacterized protein n=1 Tax=Gossypium barbadense TaxID=3634 RepID=A0A2P5WZC9_GOSBA|nr:hypothetical protein GOBAR_AA24225 [Gossypium barbadense]